MAETFPVQILTPFKKLLTTEASEVVIPASDGECGILANHENFIGLLGTGALKVVNDGNDFWYVVSKGVFKIEGGELKILTNLGEDGTLLDVEAANKKIPLIEEKLKELNPLSNEYQDLQTELQQEKTRIDVHRRAQVLN